MDLALQEDFQLESSSKEENVAKEVKEESEGGLSRPM